MKVQFEPESKQQQSDAATLQGKDMRGKWGERMQRESTGDKMRSAKTLVDSVVYRYLQYGDMVAERWRAMNQQQSQPMTDLDVRKSIASGTEAQQPTFRAYEDMFEYALEQIKLTHEVDDSTLALFTNYGDFLYECFSAVFYPTGTEPEFEEKLYQLRQLGDDFSRELSYALRQYR
jgi:hypothetical protein